MVFDATSQILAAHPITILGAVVALYGASKVGRALRAPLWKLLKWGGGAGVVLLFVVFFMATFSGNGWWSGVADGVVGFESGAVTLLVHLLDSLLAAWLRVFFLLFSGVAWLVGGVVRSMLPVLSTLEFQLLVFGFELLAGSFLVYSLYVGRRADRTQGIVGSLGSVMLITGLLAALLVVETAHPSTATARTGIPLSQWGLALVEATFGLSLGVYSTIVVGDLFDPSTPVRTEVRERIEPRVLDLRSRLDRIADRVGGTASDEE